jgi:aryl-alcohol dehydrogenase-like predicted oxidoreductase
MRYSHCQGLDKDWSKITFGCWQIAPSEGWGDVCTPQEAEAAVKTALDLNITAFDTAEGYGDGESERRLGKALGNKKYDVIVISKIWPDAELTPAAYEERLNGTLQALDRDYVDVYLIHWPGQFFDTSAKSEKLCGLMAALQSSGKTKVIGLSNFHQQDLALLGNRLDQFAVNQVPYSLLERNYEGNTRDRCQKAGIPYMAYSPTAQGLLAGRPDREALKFPTRKYNRFYQEPLYSHSQHPHRHRRFPENPSDKRVRPSGGPGTR